MTKLSVNLNAVAQLRNRRDLPWPSVTGMARIVLEAGAAGITVHPRPDERHIRRGDVFDLAKLTKAEFPDREFNIEGYPSDDFLALCEAAAPDQATFVPDDPSQATSDHGWNIAAHVALLTAAVARMHKAGIRVSLFTDADAEAPARAAGVGADRIELYTGPYGGAFDPVEAAARRADLAATADAARRLNPPVAVNAGHDLTLSNLPPLKAAIPDLAEVSIGHALIADALILGMAEAVRRYIAACA